MASLRTLVASTCAVCSTASIIDPDHSMNMTMYHINPLSAGVFPADEDTGDLDGILYFYLGTFLLPLECAHPSPRSEFDCTNPERTKSDMVHTMVEMQVDDRFTGYSLCNYCDPDGAENHNCESGTYECRCGTYLQQQPDCNTSFIGMEDMSIFVPQRSCEAALHKICGDVHDDANSCYACAYQNSTELIASGCDSLSTQDFCENRICSGEAGEEWKCWNANLASKTGGKWYSPTKEGLCTEGPGMCGWRVQSMVTVNEACVKDALMTSVEAAAPDCFSSCGARNASSPCWLGCFFDALLGSEARSVGHANVSRGMPLEDVQRAYLGAFKAESDGGCPRTPVPPATTSTNPTSTTSTTMAMSTTASLQHYKDLIM